MSRNFVNIFEYIWIEFLLFFKTIQFLDWELDAVTTFSVKIEGTFSSFLSEIEVFAGFWMTGWFCLIECTHLLFLTKLRHTQPLFSADEWPCAPRVTLSRDSRITSERTSIPHNRWCRRHRNEGRNEEKVPSIFIEKDITECSSQSKNHYFRRRTKNGIDLWLKMYIKLLDIRASYERFKRSYRSPCRDGASLDGG